MADRIVHVGMKVTADTSAAKSSLMDLQTTLSKIATTNSIPGIEPEKMRQASAAAKELSVHLSNAFNANTGKIDLTKFNKSLQNSQTNVTSLSSRLLQAGTVGDQAFLKLAQSIAAADRPMITLNAQVSKLMQTFANTVRWGITSTALNALTGAWQSMIGYAEDLNESLNDIRIVTGYGADRMADFAQEANKAAKALSTTTTEYTKASLIFFQQGLSDSEVKERTDVTIKLANAAKESVETVSDQLTSVWNNFYDGSKSLEYYADVLTKLGAATASSTDEIAGGLEKFAAVANTIGLSYEYAASALATITSNTRESEDVVGTALKTIFSRIQDLDQGKTLDDGTTLGQYSEALHKYGIEVLDASGNLRAMDDILDDMAATWDKLSSAQQVALAQAVAGVRQYNQIVALMANWNTDDADSMVANLGYTENAEGELQAQADIYAESWEAARDRVTAAAESIYSDIIDDEFMIKLTDTFASLLESVDAFIDGIGGIKTALTTVGGVFISMMSSKIQPMLNSLISGLEIVFTGRSKSAEKITAETSRMAEKRMRIVGEDTEQGIQLRHSKQTMDMKNRIVQTQGLTDLERQRYEFEISVIEAQQKEIENTAKLKREQEEEIANLERKKKEQEGFLEAQIKSVGQEKQHFVSEAKYTKRNAEGRRTTAENNLEEYVVRKETRSIKTKEYLTRSSEQYQKGIASGATEKEIAKAQELEKQLDKVIKRYQEIYQGVSKGTIAGGTISPITTLTKETTVQMEKMMSSFKDLKTPEGLEQAKVQISSFQGELEKATFGTVDFSLAFEEFGKKTYASPEALQTGFDKLIEKIKESGVEASSVKNILKNFGFSKEYFSNVDQLAEKWKKASAEVIAASEEVRKAEIALKQFKDNTKKDENGKYSKKQLKTWKRLSSALVKAKENLEGTKQKLCQVKEEVEKTDGKLKDLNEQLKQTVNSFQPQHLVNGGEVFGTLSSGIMSLSFGFSYLKSVVSTLGDEDLNWFEKISSMLPNLIFGLSSTAGVLIKATRTFKDYSKTLVYTIGLSQAQLTLSKLDLTQNMEACLQKKAVTKEMKEQLALETIGLSQSSKKNLLKELELIFQKNITDEVKKQMALEAIENAIAEGKSSKVKGNLIQKALLNKVENLKLGAEYASSAGNNAESAALSSKATSLSSLVGKMSTGHLVAYAAGLAAIAGAIYVTYKIHNKLRDAAKEANKTLEEVKNNYEEVKTAAEELKASISNWKNAEKSLEDLIKGTEEYKEALEDANNQAKELIKTYGLYNKYYIDKNTGLIKFEDDALEELQNEKNGQVKEVENQVSTAQINSNNAAQAYKTQQFKRKYNFTDGGIDSAIQLLTENELTDPQKLYDDWLQKGYLVSSKNINDIEDFNSFIAALEELKDSLDNATESNQYYAKQIIANSYDISESGISKDLYTDKEGNIDEGKKGVYEELHNSLKARASEIEDDLFNVENSFSKKIFKTNLGLDAYIQGLEGLSDDLKSDYKLTYDEDLAKVYAQIKYGYSKEDTENFIYSSDLFSGKGTLMTSSGEVIFEDVKDSIMRQVVANGALAASLKARLEESETFDEEKYEAALNEFQTTGVENLKNRFGSSAGETLNEAILTSLSKGDEVLDLSNFYSKLSPETVAELQSMTQEEWAKILNTEDFKAFGVEDGEAFLTGLIESLKNYDAISYYDSLATTATTNATNIGSILSILEEGKDLSDDQVKQLDALKEKYTDLADLQEKGGHAYLQRLREIQELEEDAAIESLQQEAAALLEKLNQINIGADTSDFDATMEDLMEVERKIKIAIEADFDSDIDQAFGLADEFEKIGSYIEDGLVISVDKAKEIIDAGYGAMLQSATTLKDGTIKLNETATKDFIQKKKDEVEADKKAKIDQFEQEIKALETKKSVFEEQKEVLEEALKSEDTEQKKQAIVNSQLAYTQYALKSDLIEAESQDEVDALTNSESNYEEYTKRISQLMATQATASIESADQTGESGVHALNQIGQTAAAVSNTIGAMYTGDATYSPVTYKHYLQNQKNKAEKIQQNKAKVQPSGERNATFEYANAVDKAAKIQENKAKAQPSGERNATFEYALDEENENKEEKGYTALELQELNLKNLLEEGIKEAATQGIAINDFLNLELNSELDSTNAQIDLLDKQIGALYGGIAALEAAGVNLDNLLDGLDSDALIDIAKQWHYLNKQIEYYNHLINQVKTEAEEAYGSDKVAAYSKQLDAVNKKLKIQGQLVVVQEEALKGQKAKLDELFGAGVIDWDSESGNIKNYYELEAAGLSDTQKEALEDYEENLSEFYSSAEELATAWKERRDLELTQLTYDISFRIEIDENNLNRLEYILKKFEDDPQSMVEQISYLDDKIEVYKNEAERYQEAIGRIYELAAAEQRTLTDAEVQQVQEYQKNLLTTNEKLEELIETIRGSFMDEIEEFSSKISDQTARFDTYSKIIDHYTNIIKLSGRASRDSGLLIEITARKTALAFEDLNVAYGEYQTLLAAQEELQKLYDAAETDEDRKYWADELEEMEKKVEEAHEGMLASWSETLEAASEEFDTRVEITIQKLKDSISAYGLENLSDRYTKAKDINEQYLSELDKEYELNKLIHQIEGSIDATDNLAAKEALNKLLDEQNKKLEKGVQLSQYDLDVANAQYELELARIALEEAQNAKSTVRLTRDSEGNYGYVYTADQNAVDDAEQNYEDKLYKLRKLSEDYIDDLSEKIIKNEEDLAEALAEINEEDYETTEAYQAELDRIKAYYLEKDRYYRTELAKAVEDLGLKYHDTIIGNLEDVSNWEEAHNNLVIATDTATADMVEAWELWKSQTELAMSTVGTSADDFSDTVQTDLDDVAQAGKDLETDLGLYLTSSGEYFESLGKKIASWSEAAIADIRNVIAASEELAAVTALTEDDFDMDTDYSRLMVESFVKGDKTAYLEAAARRKAKESVNPDITNAITDRIMDVLEAYDDATHPKHDKAVEMVGKVLAGKLYFTDESLRDYGFRTGGYTGDWGPEGKLAFLHEKELVLNQDDTENLLKTITFLRELVAMLNSQATFSGFSDLSSSRFVASTQPFEQVVTIQAEFPGVSDRYEIEEAFNTLVNRASQYANRK